jgi:hypothetical protein
LESGRYVPEILPHFVKVTFEHEVAPPFCGKNGEEFCPAVNPTDLKAAWNFSIATKNLLPVTPSNQGLAPSQMGWKVFRRLVRQVQLPRMFFIEQS